VQSDGANAAAEIIRPFDPAACGSALGEGGGILVLEALETATARGATAYAELIGFAATQSHCPDTVGLEIEEDESAGGSISDAIEAALHAAKIMPEAIDAIVPFGSSISHIDRAEVAAIKRTFGSRAKDIPLLTVIPNFGNCCAGASALSIIAAAMALKTQTLPARLHTARSDLNANAASSRSATLNHILVISCGMGGQNAAIVMKRFVVPAHAGTQ
jgi:3-oxoacyl-(acyl-carrier-protein) synthase